MATFRKLKSGRWQVVVRKPGYSKIYKTFINKLLAQRWARDTEVKIEQGKFQDYFEAQNILLKDLIQKYINENVIRQKAKKSTTHKLNFFLDKISRPHLYFLNKIFFKNEVYPTKLKIFIWDKIFTPLTIVIDFLTFRKFGKNILCIIKK